MFGLDPSQGQAVNLRIRVSPDRVRCRCSVDQIRHYDADRDAAREAPAVDSGCEARAKRRLKDLNGEADCIDRMEMEQFAREEPFAMSGPRPDPGTKSKEKEDVGGNRYQI